MVLPQKWIYGSMEQNREPRNKPTHLRPYLSSTKESRIYSEEKIVSSASSAGKGGQSHVNQ